MASPQLPQVQLMIQRLSFALSYGLGEKKDHEGKKNGRATLPTTGYALNLLSGKQPNGSITLINTTPKPLTCERTLLPDLSIQFANSIPVRKPMKWPDWQDIS
ncbi:hypothetical protein NPIL_540231 [Nephila pilipes]|uniref:Uncharacterized protein n=1 Tax=Nephila pilipes TaxID=299642 RepID=A0A8X6N3Q6_NEPPI|nr:hypothetical protein NPIL_540231 [Nephila pilipes]